MIQKITSKKLELPPIWLVENEKDWNELPKGLPRILAPKEELAFITIFLEFQVLLKSCKSTGMAVNWLDCLKRIGYNLANLHKYTLSSGGEYTGSGEGVGEVVSLDTFIEDQYIVNFDRLAELKVLPKWLDDLRASVETNIIDEVIFDPTAFNKQLGMNVGAGTLKHNIKNLLILDVSGSMPRAVVKTITNMAKLMSKKFYADVMITSGRTVLIDYNNVQSSDIIELARLSGNNNEGVMYRKIVKEPKVYGTVISFGDDDNPGAYDSSSKSTECNFKVETLYSLHTEKGSKRVTGYALWLKPSKTIIVSDWLETIEK